MADEGMFNIGELARKAFGKNYVVLIGFGSYKGTVMAGSSWGAKMQEMRMPEARAGSWEELLHEAGAENKLLLMHDMKDLTEQHIGHRAIGVVYNPKYEQYGNYVPTRMPLRYDAFIYLDETKALHALDVHADTHKMPETYPFGE